MRPTSATSLQRTRQKEERSDGHHGEAPSTPKAVSCVRIRASISDLGDPLGHPPINAVLLSVSSAV
eukprot:1578376-Prorocentrum_lima.AAC.1